MHHKPQLASPGISAVSNSIGSQMIASAISYSILARRKIQNDAKRISRLEQREEFMATMAHDLKNSFIGTNQILEILADREMGKLFPEEAALLLLVRDSNKALLSMIQNLIEVYRYDTAFDTVHVESTDIKAVLCGIIAEIALTADHQQIEIRTKLSPDLKHVMANSNDLRRVFQNLIGNALKFTPNKGRIAINLYEEGDTVVMEIADSGPGICVEDKPRLFHRFAQGKLGKRYTSGSGLGLYLCKKIIDAHRGEISCTSKEGAGASFRVSLPTAQRDFEPN